MTTTTETADHIQRMNYEEPERYDDFEMEKKVFNTGPCASKTLPTQYVCFLFNFFIIIL